MHGQSKMVDKAWYAISSQIPHFGGAKTWAMQLDCTWLVDRFDSAFCLIGSLVGWLDRLLDWLMGACIDCVDGA